MALSSAMANDEVSPDRPGAGLLADRFGRPLPRPISWANEDLARLRQGVAVWNAWRVRNQDRYVDLARANLSRADLRGANLSGAYLGHAHLFGADLSEANLSWVNLSGIDLRRSAFFGPPTHGAKFNRANLSRAVLTGVDLRDTDLSGADLCDADLRGANLSGANLSAGAKLNRARLEFVTFVGTNLTDADLTGCHIYGISAWDLKLEGAKQRDLVITRPRSDEPQITVDNIEVAQFIYLLLNNKKIRDVIDTITSKMVLILGRFTLERKAVLDALREELRRQDYLPVLFDFEAD